MWDLGQWRDPRWVDSLDIGAGRGNFNGRRTSVTHLAFRQPGSKVIASRADDPGNPQCCPLPRSHPMSRRSEEHTSELQSLMRISYAVFCLKKKKNIYIRTLQRTRCREKHTINP